jgi:mannosyltransferase
MVAAAITVALVLFFFRLGASELTPDESASWAAASAPTLAAVVRWQRVLNRGKLAIYDLLLHGWIGLAGSSLLAMRTLSALLGVAAIVLVFFAAREVLALSQPREGQGGWADYVAAASALISAASLTMVRYAREARMYPLLMTAVLAQTVLLLRARRRGGPLNYGGVALFTALAVAANLNAIFLVAAQGLWLLGTRVGRREDWGFKPIAALAAGVLVLVPLVAPSVTSDVDAVNNGLLSWISPPAWFAPLSFFNRATGTLPFPVLFALAAWGVASQWGRYRDGIVFILFWMFGPVLILFVFSLTVTPLLVERYALSCVVAFFILAALGIAAIRSAPMRSGALALVVVLSLGHTSAFLLKPPWRQWTDALTAIRAHTPAARIAVSPAHGANVLRYYLPQGGPYAATELSAGSCAGADVLLLWDHALEQPQPLGKMVAACRATFHHVLFNEKDVIVLTR